MALAIALFRPCRRQKSKELEQICTYLYLFTHRVAGGRRGAGRAARAAVFVKLSPAASCLRRGTSNWVMAPEIRRRCISFCSRRPARMFGALEQIGAMSRTLDGSIDFG